MSLRTKLVLWYTAVFGLSGLVLVVALYSLIAHKLRGEADRFLEDEFNEWVALTLGSLNEPEQLDAAIRKELAADSLFAMTYRLRDTSEGRDVVRLGDVNYRGALAAAAPIDATPRKLTWSIVRLGERYPYRLLTGPLDLEHHPHLVLQASMYTERIERRMASLRKYLFLVLVALVLLASGGGWALASRSLKPIDDMVAELSHVESSNLAERLEVGSAGGEVDRLRTAINRMLKRLNQAFDQLQSFTADVAHELRTPLSVLQCRLEVAINKPRSEADERLALSEALEQVHELNALVQNLLFLARVDATTHLQDAATIDLAALLEQVGEPFGLLAEHKGVTLSVECEDPGTVQGDGVLLRRVFGNLIDNAVRHTPSGGKVTVRAERADGASSVTVADTGSGIEPDALKHIFDRFYRADESRSREGGGAGLGLSIVKRVVDLHYGEIDVDSTPGEGTRVWVWLPARLPGAAAGPAPPDKADSG